MPHVRSESKSKDQGPRETTSEVAIPKYADFSDSRIPHGRQGPGSLQPTGREGPPHYVLLQVLSCHLPSGLSRIDERRRREKKVATFAT